MPHLRPVLPPSLPLSLALILMTLLTAGALRASPTDAANTAALCDRAAMTAAQESGVPIEVLRAIALTETGRTSEGTMRPWPWTVNMEGAGHWFQTRSAALDYVTREQARGARSFDIGCFQINHLWHGTAFRSVEAMFDPLTNARYAADFLTRLRSETGDWTAAAGAYHSRTPERARAYAARFEGFRRRLAGAPLPDRLPERLPDLLAPGGDPARRGIGPARPLFLAEAAAGGASLVPLPQSQMQTVTPFLDFTARPAL
ncbi:lytic transglycosylase domain-containing protein [Frigidibacter sp. MR17.14]|uniref:lytic transglycosylase domain-containing protein n=1 Tax=Frigidibacter sp. MR17.14 TaxID=3126509 RepID=UPI003012EDFD